MLMEPNSSKQTITEAKMNRVPCRMRDDPFYDYSDYIEGQGVYAAETEGPCDPEDDPEYLDEKQFFDTQEALLLSRFGVEGHTEMYYDF